MSKLLSLIVAAVFAAVSLPSFAASHAGAQMKDDKKAEKKMEKKEKKAKKAKKAEDKK
jgi:anaerobic C4-dicarboxylate transporter